MFHNLFIILVLWCTGAIGMHLALSLLLFDLATPSIPQGPQKVFGSQVP